MRKVQYFKGRTLEDLKATTANDAGIWPDNREGMLDSRASVSYTHRDVYKRQWQE